MSNYVPRTRAAQRKFVDVTPPRERADLVLLRCQHWAGSVPIASGPSGKWYLCPQGCGLQRRKR